MAQTLHWSTTAQIPGGPRITTTQKINIEAYDSIKLDVESGAADMEVALQPGTTDHPVKALVITSDHYSSDLSYKVNDDGNPVIIVDQPQVFMGEGAVSILDPAPTNLFFSNADAETAAIEILIGRDATP